MEDDGGTATMEHLRVALAEAVEEASSGWRDPDAELLEDRGTDRAGALGATIGGRP